MARERIAYLAGEIESAMNGTKGIRQDLENNKVPLHVHVDSEIVKGHYAEYDTFLGQEAVDYIRLDLQ